MGPPDPAASPVVVFGSAPAAFPILQDLLSQNQTVVVVEPDPFAAERSAHMLARFDCGRTALVTDTPPVRSSGTVPIAMLALEDPDDLAVVIGPLNTWSSQLPVAPVLICLDRLHLSGLGAFASRTLALEIPAPWHLRSLVELHPLVDTAPHSLERAANWLRQLGKDPMICPPLSASPGTRLLLAQSQAADMMLMDGAVPHEIDEAMRAADYDLGLYACQDLIGLTVVQRARRGLPAPARVIPIAERMVAEGRLGQIYGVGWYRYPGGGGSVIDPIVEDLIREEAWFAGIPPRSFDSEAVTMRLLLAMLCEGHRLIAEGVVANRAAIDRIAVAALGFPEHRGGPFTVAQQRGVDWILAWAAKVHAEDPAGWPGLPDQVALAIGQGSTL